MALWLAAAPLGGVCGTTQVPCLEDPNTQSYLFESAAITKYLADTYGAPPAADSSAPAAQA